MARDRRPATLEDLLFSQGFGTRRECRALSVLGRVTLAGSPADDPDMPVEAIENLAFAVDGVAWRYHARAYLALNKPAGHECSHRPVHHDSVYALLPAPLVARGVQAVGRLDADTTGLLLFSDDGQFIHRAASGRRHLPKVYAVTTQHPVTPELCARLVAGVQLADEPAPVAAVSCTATGPDTLDLVITSGKYHQVKRMIAAAGNRVAALHRRAVGKLELPPDLAPGAWCWIAPEAVLGG